MRAIKPTAEYVSIIKIIGLAFIIGLTVVIVIPIAILWAVVSIVIAILIGVLFVILVVAYLPSLGYSMKLWSPLYDILWSLTAWGRLN